MVFIIDSPPVAAVQTLFFIIIFIYAKFSGGLAAGRAPGRVFTLYKFMLFLIALVVILQMAFGGGLITGLMIACRIISLIIMLPLLTMTSPPGDLALCLTRLGFNYKTAYIITSALNILPSFQEDAKQLLDARKLRRFAPASPRSVTSLSMFAMFGEYPKIALPMMIKMMRRASAAGLAMDARAFGAYRARTWRRETEMKAVDFTVLTAGFVYAAIAITANYIIK